MLSYVLQLVSIDKRMDALPDPCGLLTCLGALFCHNLIFYNRSKDAKEGDSFGLARVSISESASRELTFICVGYPMARQLYPFHCQCRRKRRGCSMVARGKYNNPIKKFVVLRK